MTDIGIIIRHTKTRETGATVTTERTGPGSWVDQTPGWVTLCLDHGQLAHHDTRADAIAHHPYPANWCGDCRAIADGKRPRITGRRKIR